MERQLTVSHNKHEDLKAEYTTFTRTLQETEQALARANTVRVYSHLYIAEKLPTILWRNKRQTICSMYKKCLYIAFSHWQPEFTFDVDPSGLLSEEK